MITDLAKKVDIASLKDSFVFANTPSFLYKRFRSDASVQNVAENSLARELITSFNKLLKQKPKELNRVVELYAIIAALSLQDGPEISPFFDQLGASGITWGQQLRDLYKAGLRQQKIYLQPQKYRMPSLTDTSAETPTTTVIVQGAPISAMVPD